MSAPPICRCRVLPCQECHFHGKDKWPEDLIRLMVRLYNSGYQSGHEDTVESRFTLIHRADHETYHAEEVTEIITDWINSGPPKSDYSSGWNAALTEARRQIQSFALQSGLNTESSAAECDRIINDLMA